MSALELYIQARAKSLAVPCVVINEIELAFEAGYIATLLVCQGNSRTHSCIGIHLNNPDENEIEDAIETAIKDGFERIYVYR